MPGATLTERNEFERRIRDLEAKLGRGLSQAAAAPNAIVYGVTLTGSLTGSTFTMSYSDLRQESIHLVLRGRLLKPGVNFTISAAVLTMVEPSAPFEAGDPVQSFDNFFIVQAERSGA